MKRKHDEFCADCVKAKECKKKMDPACEHRKWYTGISILNKSLMPNKSFYHMHIKVNDDDLYKNRTGRLKLESDYEK